MADSIKVGVLGASGYTGADFIRLALNHPKIEIVALTANSHAGKPMADVFPHLAPYGLPDLTTVEETDWSAVDAIVCGLPHGTTQALAKSVLVSHPHLKFIDMSADFRLRDPETYATWYGHDHQALELQAEAVYGLTEHNRADIQKARIVACPGCYPTAALLSLLPLAAQRLIDVEDIIIDAKSGVSGAGRGLKQNTLFTEAGEGLSPYSVGKHRHGPEIDQEIGKAADQDVVVNFTPHLIPMNRGELCTSYVRLTASVTVADLRAALTDAYQNEPFVHVVPETVLPKTQNVRGSNHCQIGVVADRISGRAIVISVLDNLVKGSAGQALQNLNLVFDIEETTGLKQVALFP